MSKFDIYYKKNDNSKLFSYLSEKLTNKIKIYSKLYSYLFEIFSLNETNFNKINLNHKYNIHAIKNEDYDKKYI